MAAMVGLRSWLRLQCLLTTKGLLVAVAVVAVVRQQDTDAQYCLPKMLQPQQLQAVAVVKVLWTHWAVMRQREHEETEQQARLGLVRQARQTK